MHVSADEITSSKSNARLQQVGDWLWIKRKKNWLAQSKGTLSIGGHDYLHEKGDNIESARRMWRTT